MKNVDIKEKVLLVVHEEKRNETYKDVIRVVEYSVDGKSLPAGLEKIGMVNGRRVRGRKSLTLLDLDRIFQKRDEIMGVMG